MLLYLVSGITCEFFRIIDIAVTCELVRVIDVAVPADTE